MLLIGHNQSHIEKDMKHSNRYKYKRQNYTLDLELFKVIILFHG